MVGCTPNEETFLDIPNVDFNTCDDNCVTDKASIDVLMEGYGAALNDLSLEIAPESNGDVFLLASGETYDREDLKTADEVTNNFDIPIFYPLYEFGLILEKAVAVYDYCVIGEDCLNPLIQNGMDIIRFGYGFTETAGYVLYTLGENDEELVTTSIEFQIDDEFATFSYIEWYHETDQYIYELYNDGIYWQYQYADADSYMLYYIDESTGKSIKYYHNTPLDWCTIYDPENQTVYHEAFLSGEIRVDQFDGMSVLAGLAYDGETYTLSLNFHYVTDWNRL